MLDYIRLMGIRAQMKFREFCHKENGDVNVVSIVVLIGIAVVLALIFRKEIVKILKSLFTDIGTNAGNAIKPE